MNLTTLLIVIAAFALWTAFNVGQYIPNLAAKA